MKRSFTTRLNNNSVRGAGSPMERRRRGTEAVKRARLKKQNLLSKKAYVIWWLSAFGGSNPPPCMAREGIFTSLKGCLDQPKIKAKKITINGEKNGKNKSKKSRYERSNNLASTKSQKRKKSFLEKPSQRTECFKKKKTNN